jgi:hypothetical protein
MPRRFDFISPGVSTVEVDESIIASEGAEENGILLIGTAPRGPANKPVKVRNLEDFYRVFGKPISGKGATSADVWRKGNQQATTYAMYAAQAWLAAGVSPVNYVRLLGIDSSNQASGYIKAGWQTEHDVSKFAALGAAAYGLFIMPSRSVGAQGEVLSGTLAAVIYASGSSMGLAGTLGNFASARAATTTGGLSNTFVISDSSTGAIKNTFKLRISSSVGTSVSKTFHFDASKKDGYIRNVLNCNPQKLLSVNYGSDSQEKYFLGATYEEAVDTNTLTSASAGEQFGIILPLYNSGLQLGDNRMEAKAAKTGWFINRHPSPFPGFANYKNNSESKLFRFVSLHEGEWFQNNYGVRIENLKLGSVASPDSTFSVVIVDPSGVPVESFSGLNLNESSPDFIGKKIGDQYQTFNNTLDKYEIKGEYPNVSDYIRVQMADDWKAGISDTKMLPFGVYGPQKPLPLQFSSASTTSGTNTLGVLASLGTWDQGHTGSGATLFMDIDYRITCSLHWPDIKLTAENTNNSGNYTKDYAFGVRHMLKTDNKPKKVLYHTEDYKDLVRALPYGLDIHGDTSSDYLIESWIFSLDDIVLDTTDSTKFYYESGSHVGGTSVTSKYGGTTNILTGGVKQFNAPFFGGFDGLDIKQIDPFSIANGLSNSYKDSTHYANYTVKRTLNIVDDVDIIDFDVISMPGLINTNLTQDLINVAEERSDSLAIIDIDSGYRKSYENSGTELLGDSTLGGSGKVIDNARSRDYNTSYAATYYPPVRIRDTVSSGNDVTIVPASVAAIGAIASSEANSEGPWFAPAGFNRGGLSVLGGSSGPNVIGTIEHLTKQNRDDLYEENINPIARFPAVGEIVIFGQKTLQQTASALDRINVRRLMIYLKKKIGKIANTILFDQNVRATWLRFKSAAERVLSNVQSRFGVTEYKLVLDETTTTADLIDRNILYAKVFIKPARAIEFIAIDFVITKTGIEL